MVTEKIELKIVTPLFMSGTDSNKAELRVPSIKGVMRYFYRAAMAEDNLEKLREKEVSSLGGIIRDKSLRSPVELYVPKYTLRVRRYYPLPHKKNFKKECFYPSDTFAILFSSSSLYKYKLDKFLNLFYLTLLMGGFGKRSRRGFGSLSYKEFSNVDAFKQELKKLFYSFNGTKINWNDNENNIYSEAKIHENKKYIYPVIRSVFISKNGFDSWEKAVESIGYATHNREDSGKLGYASKSGRLASPIIISVKQIGRRYHIVASIMNSLDKSIYEKFLNNILEGKNEQ